MSYTTAQAASQIGRSAEMVRRWCVSGALPAVRHGRDWLIREEDLVEFRPRSRGRPRGAPSITHNQRKNVMNAVVGIGERSYIYDRGGKT